MKHTQKRTAAFSLVELLLVIAIVGILIFVSIPRIGIGPSKAPMTTTLANAKSLQTATQMMSLDTDRSGADGMIWTSMRSNGKTTPASLSAYFDALVKNGYLTAVELRKILTAPGKGPHWRAPHAKNICFTIFQIDDEAPSDQPFLVTANWKDGQLTDDAPYRKKGFVVFNKGGGGGVYKRSGDASSTNIFPTAGKNENGTVYRYVPLK